MGRPDRLVQLNDASAGCVRGEPLEDLRGASSMEEFKRLDITDKLKRIVEAITLTEDELLFQVRRLEVHVRPRTEEEKKYHEDLKHGYETAAYWIRTLKRYHEGRLERLMRGESLTRQKDDGEEGDDHGYRDDLDPWDATVDDDH